MIELVAVFAAGVVFGVLAVAWWHAYRRSRRLHDLRPPVEALKRPRSWRFWQKHHRPPEGFSPVYREYAPGDYERVFTLSEDIDAERIEARVKGGVLRLFLPKAGPAETRRVQIRAD